jgi:hypothetical protein
VPNFRSAPGRQLMQLSHAVSTFGPAEAVLRVRRKLARSLEPKEEIWPVRPEDIANADVGASKAFAGLPHRSGEPLQLNWVMLPPTVGSGGHTTIFRMINHLEAAGHINRVYFYDPYDSDHRHYARTVKHNFAFNGPVADLSDAMADAHAIIATSWPTAYAVYNAPGKGKRCYFVQDYEPLFHPAGAMNLFAENTYRMGFHAITAGRWLADKLSLDFGMDSDHFDFGSDTSHYKPIAKTQRDGVAFYCRSGTARRGTELGLMALRILAERRPDVPIHLYGDAAVAVDFPAVIHGVVSPTQLNFIYNTCRAGLSLSFTNVSLVPHEMLASGCIPVVNDAPQNRLVLNNSFVRYASPTPHALASEIESLLDMTDFAPLSRAAAGSLKGSTWEAAGKQVERILKRAVGQKAKGPAHAELEW